MNKLRFFDFEVFPHWWCCVFGDMPEDMQFDEDIKQNFVFVSSDDTNCREKLINLMREENVCNVGYNIKHYDLMIANAIYQGFTPEQVKIVNDIIIRPDLAYSTKEHIRLQPFANRKLSGITYQDLRDDDDKSMSLKEKEAILGLNILETSIPFDKEDLSDEDKAEILYYCNQDVYASMRHYKEVIHEYTMTKKALGDKYGIPEKTWRMSTNASLISKVLGAKRMHFADEEKIEISLPTKIEAYCKQNVPAQILNKLLTSQDNWEVKAFGNIVSYGNGGIHSVYDTNRKDTQALYVESDGEYCLVNVDAASYYPSMLIQFDCLSRTVEDKQKFIDIYNERIAIKHKDNPTKEDEQVQKALKLVLNTAYGASGNKYLDMYDPYMCSRCCRLGQIFLTALACKIYNTITSARIIQTNTDGILVYINRNDLDKLQKCMDEWTAVSGIGMDRDEVAKIWQRDVNNYLLVKTSGKIKRKGAWLMDDFHRPGTVKYGPLDAFVCSKAATKYLVEGIDPAVTLVQCKNLTDFAITCKKGPTYFKVVQRYANGHEEELFKCNRVIATKDKSLGKLYKVKRYKGDISYGSMPDTPDNCLVVNEALNTYDFKEIKKQLDYTYYLQRIANMLDIQWKELYHNDLIDNNQFIYE